MNLRDTAFGLGVLAMLASGAGAQTVTVDFSNGAEGWRGPPNNDAGGTTIEPTGGNNGEYMRTQFNDFGVSFRNTSNPDFLSDYTTSDEITLSIDLQVELINWNGQDTSKPWLVDLRNYDIAQGGLPWTSVWFLFDNISQANNGDWTTYSVTFDPNSTELPMGWGGYGDEDPDTFEPILPEGVTFAEVVSSVDEIVFTTLQPGIFFGFVDHTIGIDNITITRNGAVCRPDLNNDGVLDFFDVSAFINAFASQDAQGDFNNDGKFDFFDVSGFINAFNNGCV